MIEIDKILDAQRKWHTASTNGDAVRNIAVESFTVCADAIAILGNNLKGMGYAWASAEQIPSDVLKRNILTIEKFIGMPIPPILVMFWEKVGGVSFVDLKGYQHVDFWKEHKIIGPRYFCDGLFVDPCSDEWTSFVNNDFLDWKEYREDETDNFLLSLSPDGYHKDKISGGAPYGVYAESSWKPIWQNFEWSGAQRPVTAITYPPDFLSYLRTTILECAGFPAFLGLERFEPIREHLLLGVPIF